MWSTIIICLTLLLVLDNVRPLLERLVAIRERATEPARPQEAVSIPDDLYALAQSYEDPWAREQAMQAMREMYGDSSSWDVVRVRYGLDSQGNR